MLIVSFNVNGIRARVHQIEALIERYQPDVIGLQETKVTNEQFPMEWVNGLGYQAYIHGQKTHYGVALLSKLPAVDLQYGFPTDEEDAQRRMIMGTFNTPKGGQLRVLNGYFPQGENIKHEVKFPAKRRFYSDLSSYLENSASPDEPLLVMGDLNISATDLDIGIGDANRKRWLQTGKTSFQPEERAWLKKLYDWGLTDSYRALHPERADLYSWFDYRSRGFEDTPKRGLRIDAIMPTQPLLEQCTDASIELEIRGMEKPSDHAPVLARFDI